MAKRAEGLEEEREPQEIPSPGPAILEPHSSLRYVGTLFKALAVAVFLLLLAEVVLGLWQDGAQALPLLLLEVAQLLVFSGLLWGGGDLAYLVVETNHDVRASRVLLWQLSMFRQMEMRDRGLVVDAVNPEDPLPEGESATPAR